MRKFTSLILLVIILFVSNGYHLYFKYLQYQIQEEVKHEIKNGLNEKDLSLIIVSTKNINKIKWTKKNKEFSYKGEMYDVVKIKTENNKTYFYCLNDVKEKDLIANYSHHNRHKNNILSILKKVLNSKYIQKSLILNSKHGNTDIHFSNFTQLYKSVFSEILSPPPKIQLLHT